MGAPERFDLDRMLKSAESLYDAAARAIAPRETLTVSQWADAHRVLSTKSSPRHGRWRTDNNPILREPMDSLSARSPVNEVVLCFPIQQGKSEVGTNFVGYTMDHDPGPMIVALPGEVSMKKWVNQKLNPLIEETEAVRESLTSNNSRNAANQKEFKDFAGGQLYVEHAGSPARLKSTTAKKLYVDEFTEFSENLKSGDDPEQMLDGRTSAYTGQEKRLYVSTPGIKGRCRIWRKWEKSDQRRYHVRCPHCNHPQPLVWDGLKWALNAAGKVTDAWYVCRDCGAMIEEHHKTQMFKDAAAGGTAEWVPENPGAESRGYTSNCLYYQIGMGPRWARLAQMWLDAQNDQADLKTFINDRLAEPWEDRSLSKVRHNLIQDRAEAYPLRLAPHGVVWITAGVDTQDDRLEVQIVGWGVARRAWTLDYAVLHGDPAHEEVWTQLTDILNRPIQHACGAMLPVSAAAIDGRGHRTEFVKQYARQALVRRPMTIFGAKAANAVPLGKPRLEDVTPKGRTDPESIQTWQVGTIAIKHMFYRRLAGDAEQERSADRLCHFPQALASHNPDSPMPGYFEGLVSEVFDPSTGRYRKKKSNARNEPLDTWVYAYAATQHPELALHRYSRADWDRDQSKIFDAAGVQWVDGEYRHIEKPSTKPGPEHPSQPDRANPQRRIARSNYLTKARR